MTSILHSAAPTFGSAIVSMLEVEPRRRPIDIEPDHAAIGIEIDIEPFDNLPRLRACV